MPAPTDQAVDDLGCTGAQRIDLECVSEDFSNHGGYVSCVAQTGSLCVDLGTLTNKERARFVSAAARSK